MPGSRKTTRRYPRRFADDFAASGQDVERPGRVRGPVAGPMAAAASLVRSEAGMSRDVVYTLHLWPPLAHAAHYTGSDDGAAAAPAAYDHALGAAPA